MDIAKYVAKARPGVLGGQCAEKRPLRERIMLPVDKRIHNCETYHILIGAGSELSGLKAEFVIGEEKAMVESPVGVHVPAGVPHSQRLMESSGHFFNIVPKGDYNDSLI